MKRRLLIALPALGVSAVAVAAATGHLGGHAGGAANAALTGPPATAKVEKRTLIRTQTVTGTLGYGDETEVPAAPGGGMLTWLPRENDVIERGETVYRVDQKRVPLLYGSIPIYRVLSPGSKGDDVRQLERNLTALGYTGFTADDLYSASTAAAVKKWQKAMSRERTGVVRPGDAVVSSGARRVVKLTGSLGTSAAGALLSWTGTTRIVTADLDTQYADLVKVGTKATVDLPDDTSVAARVTEVGAPTSKKQGTGATLPVRLAVTDQQKLGRYQVAQVDVELVAGTREDVLAVPITALVARPGGGYALMAVTGAGTSYLPVRTGLFGQSYVEVSGAGVVAGLTVGVPK
jgi:peptidoglycan hydrolase-like protein with peptidoglycan-binding domain